MSALSSALAAMKKVLVGVSGYATTWDWYADRIDRIYPEGSVRKSGFTLLAAEESDHAEN